MPRTVAAISREAAFEARYLSASMMSLKARRETDTPSTDVDAALAASLVIFELRSDILRVSHDAKNAQYVTCYR